MGSINTEAFATDQLTHNMWLDWETAVHACEHPALEILRKSHGMLSRVMFMDALKTGQLEILLLPNDAVALTAWGLCEEGKTLHVLTMYTSMDYADETFEAITTAAREAGAQCIMAVTRHGWREVARRNDCEVFNCLFIKKVL